MTRYCREDLTVSIVLGPQEEEKEEKGGAGEGRARVVAEIDGNRKWR